MERRPSRLFPLAYHLSIQAYGRWVPGDPRGWHHRGDGPTAPPRPGNDALRAIVRERQRHPAASLGAFFGGSLAESVTSVATTHGWTIHALAMVDSHLHVVVTAAATGVETIRVIREETTAFLTTRGLIEPSRPLWSAGGYFSMIYTVAGLDRACRYVARHLEAPGG